MGHFLKEGMGWRAFYKLKEAPEDIRDNIAAFFLVNKDGFLVRFLDLK